MKKNIFSLMFLVTLTFVLAGCDYMKWLSPQLLSTSEPSTPAAGSDLTVAQLKYRLIDQFGGVGASQGIHYCDPDSFPVARVGAEQQQAAKLFPTISADAETFAAILDRLKLTGTTTFTDDHKLLIYQEYKKLNAVNLDPAPAGYQFKFAYKSASGGFQVEGVISKQGVVTIQKQDSAGPIAFSCPICLVGDTRIDTPSGPVAVRDLRQGMIVWTVDKLGQRQAAAILKTAQINVAFGHEVIHLRLSDGRELFASPPHPTADGRLMADLIPGDKLDGAEIISLERVAYPDAMTYDILPAGDTGFYWANGILVGSTLTH